VVFSPLSRAISSLSKKQDISLIAFLLDVNQQTWKKERSEVDCLEFLDQPIPHTRQYLDWKVIIRVF